VTRTLPLRAVISGDPSVIRFDVVRCASLFEVPSGLRPFFQAEVLVPSQVAPSFIHFPLAFSFPLSRPLVALPSPSPLPPPDLLSTPPHPPPFAPEIRDSRGVWFRLSTGLVLWGKRSRSSFSSRNWREVPGASFWQKTGPCSGFWQETNQKSSQEMTPRYGVRGEDDIVAAWEAVNRASLIASRKGDVEGACILLQALPRLPPPPTTSPPLLVEVIPPPSICEFHVGSKSYPSCLDCVAGLLFCPAHEALCGGEAHTVCNHCKRTLCADHVDCSCADAQALRTEISRRSVNPGGRCPSSLSSPPLSSD
jgi:hypothetical protein